MYYKYIYIYILYTPVIYLVVSKVLYMAREQRDTIYLRGSTNIHESQLFWGTTRVRLATHLHLLGKP